MRTLRLVRRLTVMNVMATAEYRGAFLVYMTNAVVVPTVSLLVWLAVSDAGVSLPYDRRQFITYFVLLSVVSVLTSSWLAPWVAEQIRLGGISPFLLLPAPYILSQVGNNLGEKVVKLPLLLPLVGLVTIAFHDGLALPSNPTAWLLFLLALPMAAAVSFLLDFVLGSLAFWVQDVDGLVRVAGLLGAFLSGQIVPLALFPTALSGFLEAQPYRYTLSFPLEVLTGRLGAGELARGFALQAVYCVGLWALYRALWRLGLRAYSAAGA